MPGLLEPGDSGGPLYLLEDGTRHIAGVNSLRGGRYVDGQCPGEPSLCSEGEQAYNVWASVPDQLSFLLQALYFAQYDYDADYVSNFRDNCPWDYNPRQDNANEDFERELGATLLGDACDPSPVAQPWPGPLGFTLDADLWDRCTGDADLSDCVVRLERHHIDLETHWWSDEAAATTTATTGFRYCICRDEDGQPIADKFTCKNEEGCLIDNLDFPKPEGLDPAQGETPWLRMSVLLWGSEHGNSIRYPVGSELLLRRGWDWESDAPEWQAAGFWDDPVSPPPGFESGPYIAGLMWGHNDSVLGSDEHMGFAPGTCASLGVGAQCGFGNSYLFWNPVSSSYACPDLPEIPEPVTTGAAGSQSAAATGAPEPRYFPERSRVLDVPLPATPQGATFLPFASARFGDLLVSPGFAVPCEAAAGRHVAELTLRAEDNVARLITEAFSPELRTALLDRTDLLWVAPSEPVELAGGSAALLSIAIDRYTGALAVAMAPDGLGGLGLAGDIFPLPKLSASASVSPAALGPTAYSRVRGELVQLTGSSRSEPLDTIRLTPLFGTTTERELWPADERPMSVQAATYSFTDGRLWLVATREEVPCARCERKLLVIDTQTGRVERIRPLLPSLSRFWLTNTTQGEVALVAAPKRGAVFVAAVFEPEQLGAPARAELAGLRMQVGRVMGAPRVSGDTLLVPVGSPAARRRPTDPRLHYVTALGLEELREGVHGRCFHRQSQP